VSVVRGTANLLVTLSVLRVTARFRTLTRRCQVLALQEWPRGRNQMLADAGRLVWWPRRPGARPVKPRGAWTFHRARLGGGPIGVRNDLGEQVRSCRAVVLARPGFVGRVPGRRSLLGPSISTRLKTELPDGTTKVRYGIHLTAGVQIGKAGYRRDKASARRVARHQRERATLERRVARDQAKYGRHNVEVLGDTNFHHMPIAGLVGWWPAEPEAGTFGSRAIDGIYTGERPDDVQLLAPLVRGEHRSVITTEAAR
jgi:hypothetical protein